MKRACVIGWPIAHSRSPIIHNFWLQELGIDGLYEKQPVKPEELAQFLSSLHERGYSGCNVTIPHKEAVFQLAKPDAIAKRLRAANTLYFADGELQATNTDVEGFWASLKADVPGFSIEGKPAMVLGAGGAARAVIVALLDAGAAEIRVANRTLGRAEELAGLFGDKIKPVDWAKKDQALSDVGLLVNTTALGMEGQPSLEISLENLPPKAAVSDLIYVPLQTRLIEAAQEAGHPVSGGLGMLLHQAVRGFELWFGKRPQVTPALRSLVEADVRRKS